MKKTTQSVGIEEELQNRLSPKLRQREGGVFLWIVPKLKCKSGLEMSVQASQYHYCSPRTDEGFWYQVEVGYPSKKVDKLMDFAEDKSEPTDTVYGYVPIEIVAEVIQDNGGFAE